MKYSHVAFENAVRLTENGYNMAAENDLASWFALSNGYLGVRGTFEEYNTGGMQGAYIRGVLGYIPNGPTADIQNEYMKKWYFNEEAMRNYEYGIALVNLADILFLRFTVNGETFFPWEGTVLAWKRTLDLQKAVLTREVRWQNSKGEITCFVFRRFSSFADDHTFAIQVEATPENYDGTIIIESGIDTVAKSMSGSGAWVLTADRKTEVCGNTVTYTCNSCKQLPIAVAIGAALNLYKNNTPLAANFTDNSRDGIAVAAAAVTVEKGKTVTAEKIVYMISARDTDADPAEILRQNNSFNCRFADLLAAHTAAYTEAFSKLDIKIEGDDSADCAVRFSNYHTLCSFNRNDAVHSLAPKGLTGYGYAGMVWWDCEVYQAPVFYATMPQCAKNMLLYRYRLLNAALENAAKQGFGGARYPFNSGISGKELVWPVSRHPFMQIHIVSDVAWSICNYYNHTGDDAFMLDYGCEMLFQIARFWVSRVQKTNRGYEILQVTGTDEQHPYVDNNAYTNYCVCYLLKRLLSFCRQYGEKLDALKKRIGITAAEINAFADLAQHLYLPLDAHTGLIPQFDGYFDLSRNLEQVGANNNDKALQFTAGLYHKSQVIKQPDVLVLFAYQSFDFGQPIYSRNWDYYRARCESASSLSYSVHSVCASDNEEPESAYQFLMKTALMDLDDAHGGTAAGIHASCAAGAFYAAVRGIGGTIIGENGITVRPRMIPWWKSLSYSVVWHGNRVHISVTNEKVTVTADSENPGNVKLNLCGKAFSLNAGACASANFPRFSPETVQF